MKRPAFKLTESAPGSDLLAETSAAFAAASIVFKSVNPEYSEECLKHSKQLYDFANEHRGRYSDSIPDALTFYKYVKTSNYKLYNYVLIII